MMTAFEMWLTTGIISIALIIAWYFFRKILAQILTQLKEMNASMKVMSDKSIVHDGKLEMVQKQVGEHKVRLDDHSQRIRAVERKQDACATCNET